MKSTPSGLRALDAGKDCPWRPVMARWMLPVLALASLVPGVPAEGAIIWHQPLNTASGGSFSNLGPSNQQTADTFNLSAPVILDSILWSGRYSAPQVVADPVAFSIRFFAETAGVPNTAPIQTFNVTSNATVVGANDYLSYSAPISLALAPGDYWVSVVEDDARTALSGGSQWLWGHSLSGDTSKASRLNDSSSWSVSASTPNYAFTLNGTVVPEPARAFLALLGLASLAMRRHRGFRGLRSGNPSGAPTLMNMGS